MNRIRSIIIASDASNPGILLSSSSGAGVGVGAVTDADGVSDGKAIGDGEGDTAGEGVNVTAGERVGFGVDVEVANFSFHAFIPSSML